MPYCPNCGKEIKEDDKFCPSCGQPLWKIEAQTQAHQIVTAHEEVRHRPTGVTILAILEALGGLLLLIGGIFLFLFAGFFIPRVMMPREAMGLFPFFISGFLGVIGVVLLIIAALNFLIAYGFWNGRGWAWTLGIIFACLGLIMGLFSLPSGIIQIIINALILYYLTRPNVKRYFGK